MTNRLLGASLLVLALVGCALLPPVPPDPPPEIFEPVPPPPPEPSPPPPSDYYDWTYLPRQVSSPTGPYGQCSASVSDRCNQESAGAASSGSGMRSSSLLRRNGRAVVEDPQSLIRPGVGAFVEPPPMIVDQPGELKYAIALTSELLQRQLGGRKPVQALPVSVAPRVRVTLREHSLFEIRGPNGQSMPLDAGRASWQWTVVPKQKGNYTLQADVEPLAVRTDGTEIVLTGFTEEVSVDVDVSAEAKAEQEHEAGTKDLDRTRKKIDSYTAIALSVAALIAALSLIVWRLRSFGGKPETGKA